jgi:hypothetical protein
MFVRLNIVVCCGRVDSKVEMCSAAVHGARGGVNCYKYSRTPLSKQNGGYCYCEALTCVPSLWGLGTLEVGDKSSGQSPRPARVGILRVHSSFNRDQHGSRTFSTRDYSDESR